MNLLEDHPHHKWQREAYYQAARRRTVTQQQGTWLGVVEIHAGGQLLPHVQPLLTLYCCIRGEGIYTRDDHEQALQWGDVLEIPPRTIHSFAAKGDTSLVLLILQWPEEEQVPPATFRELLGKLAGRLS